MPFPLNKSGKIVCRRICKGAVTEEEKAWMIYSWIAKHIRYDVQSVEKLKTRKSSPGFVLLRRKAVCQGYSNLFLAMCKEAGLTAHRVEGYSKSFYFDPGDRFFKDEHIWNVVRLDGKWFLIDVAFGAGYLEPRKMPVRTFLGHLVHLPVVHYKLKFKKKFAPDYFCMDPKLFLIEHDPVDPIWQLIPKEQSLHVFEFTDPFADSTRDMISTPVFTTGTTSSDADAFVKTEPISQLITNADRGYEYDVRNNRVKAYAEIALADSFYNSVRRMKGDPAIQIVQFNRVADHCQEAISYLGCQHYDIQEEYKLLGEKNKAKNTLALKEIKMLTDSNNRKIKDLKKLISADASRKKRIRGLVKAENKSAGRFEKNSLELVTPAKQVLRENDSLVVLNRDSIRINQLIIDSLVTEINSLKQKREGLQNGFYSDDGKLLADLFIEELNIKQTIVERIKLRDNYKWPIKALRKELAKTKISEAADYREAISAEAATAKLAGIQISADIDKIRTRLKANEKFIKTSKHITAESDRFDQDFDKVNDVLVETTDKKKELLSEEKHTLKMERKYLRRDVVHYRKQNSLLHNERATENERMRREKKRLARLQRHELMINTRLQKYAKAMDKRCKKNSAILQKQIK